MSQTLEFILQQRYQATGRGLHEKLTSVESEIPESARKQIRYVATMRNKAVHEDVTLAEENLPGITKAYRSALAALDGQNMIADSLANSNYGRSYDGPQQSRSNGLTLDRPARPQRPRRQSGGAANAQRNPSTSNPSTNRPSQSQSQNSRQPQAQRQPQNQGGFDFGSLPKRGPKKIKPLHEDAPYVPPQTRNSERREKSGVSAKFFIGIVAGLIALVGILFFALMSALTSK